MEISSITPEAMAVVVSLIAPLTGFEPDPYTAPLEYTARDVFCLAQNAFWEARNQSDEGRRLTGWRSQRSPTPSARSCGRGGSSRGRTTGRVIVSRVSGSPTVPGSIRCGLRRTRSRPTLTILRTARCSTTHST